jgi:hypothetical protein
MDIACARRLPLPRRGMITYLGSEDADDTTFGSAG